MIDGYPMNIKGYLQKVIIQSFLFCSLSRYIKRWTSINIRPHFVIVQYSLNDPASSNTQKFRLFGRTNLVHGIYGLKEKFWNLNFRQVEILFKVIWRFELLWVKSRGFRGQMYTREKTLQETLYGKFFSNVFWWDWKGIFQLSIVYDWSRNNYRTSETNWHWTDYSCVMPLNWCIILFLLSLLP